MTSRRTFLLTPALLSASQTTAAATEQSLNGPWTFRLPDGPPRAIQVPHTWQIDPSTADYYGPATYTRTFDAPNHWRNHCVRVEFEAVFHSAIVSVNGAEVGRHERKGYTAFTFDISKHLKLGAENTLTVRVDNAFNDRMLPRGKSSDWTHDGGIYRPVRLLITPPVYIERVDIDCDSLKTAILIRNTTPEAWTGTLHLDYAPPLAVKAPPNETTTLRTQLDIARPHLWHFDDPYLYTLNATLTNGAAYATTFGVRRIEVKADGFYLNNERIRPMGVERMAGSNPQFGMAEPSSWIEHDHADMKELNCIFTRVHWQQDRRVLDYCDRHGILIQLEVPTWGPQTFAEKTPEPLPGLMQNGIEQLTEMIQRDRNHPSIFAWGLCNEINGQNPPAYRFAERMFAEARKLDPTRPLTYASNSLQRTPGKDVSRLMDFISWNEYYESWMKGDIASLRRNLAQIIEEIPNKPIVVSEYGYCACTAERPEGDEARIRILREHNKVFREFPSVAGLIFFCYNDYRTHIGDRGKGVAQQRVHGVVDLYGRRKPSFEALREESSPIEIFSVEGSFRATVKTRTSIPSYSLAGYTIRGVLFGQGDIPVEQVTAALPTLKPGETASLDLRFTQKGERASFDILRPTGFTVLTRHWSASK